MMKIYENGIKVPKVHDYGVLDQINKGFAIIKWINGTSLDKLLINSKDSEKYGILVANELKKIHSIDKSNDIDLKDKYLESLNSKIKKIKQMNINSNIDFHYLNNYVHNNLSLFRDKNSSIIHGDLHPGNIIVDETGSINFIDLDACKTDFSWIDLITNACNMDFPNFYSVLINNYFDNSIPDDFWTLYNMYGILYCLGNILYCNRMENKSILEGINNYDKFMNFTNNLCNEEPNWFYIKKLRKELKK